MRGVFVVYFVISMFLTVAETEGFHGAAYDTGLNITNVQTDISDVSYEYTNSTGITEPAFAVIGFLNVYLGIAANSLVFNFSIQGAPAVVNLFVGMVFGVMAWIAFYDFMVIALAVVVGVIGRL